MRDRTSEELKAFEEEIKELYLAGKIHAPVHLAGGNEDALIEIFKEIKPTDWVFSTYRSHFHALLHGIDAGWLKDEIIAGRSMHIYNREHNFFTSSIVAGCCPIAVGTALGIKRQGRKEHVWCFLGDMAGCTGSFYEARTYSRNFELPITFVIEDNGLSTETPTRAVWGLKEDLLPEDQIEVAERWEQGKVLRYRYHRKYPHSGAGSWVHF